MNTHNYQYITSKNKQQKPTEVVKQVADFNNDEIVIVAMQCCLWTSYDIFLFNKNHTQEYNSVDVMYSLVDTMFGARTNI